MTHLGRPCATPAYCEVSGLVGQASADGSAGIGLDMAADLADFPRITRVADVAFLYSY